MATKVVTVLKTGGEYNRDHVHRIREQVRHWAPGIEFQCLSDDWLVPGYTELKHNWPGWWSKMEVYTIPGPVLYIDLDTTIVKPLAPLLQACAKHELIVLRDFNPKQRLLGTGLMGWSGTEQANFYHKFSKNPKLYIERGRNPRWWGDQGFIEEHCVQENLTFWQDLFPGEVVSYKKHCTGGLPPEARVVCFHGRPRPWQNDVTAAFRASLGCVA